MDTPSPDPLPSPLPGEDERPLAGLPQVPKGHCRRRPPGRATSSGLRASRPRKRGRPPKSGPEPTQEQGPPGPGNGGGLLLIDDQGVPYTVSAGDTAGVPAGSGPSRAPHFCPVCLRAFPYLSDLERHSISHSELKPHECKDCGKAFKRSSHLRRHSNIHAGLRPFRCALCPGRFREAGELAHHQRVHSGERPYQCPLCHLRFTEANTLRRHYKRKHPELAGVPVRLCPPDPTPALPWGEEGVPIAADASLPGEGPKAEHPAWPAPPGRLAGAGQGAEARTPQSGAGPALQGHVAFGWASPADCQAL
ncbi:zinc finger protein 524 [Dipodomys spectabilis]|uniref:zinc finger protein 524 n=1 Tax=Dipodomys spectabilis TaxID=105255 RepID=UPI001C545C44|nr:zinc finger protein 524 [Dipodomys spectabilis]